MKVIHEQRLEVSVRDQALKGWSSCPFSLEALMAGAEAVASAVEASGSKWLKCRGSMRILKLRPLKVWHQERTPLGQEETDGL